MLRKEQFAFGVGLVASALAFLLTRLLAWFVLIVGLGLIFDFYFRELVWGADRLTREEIEGMSAEEYKNRVLKNFKTRRWVDWLDSGRDAFKKQMRKLAREVVIFALLTMPLCLAGEFVHLRKITPRPFDLKQAKILDEIPAGKPPCPPSNDKRRVWIQSDNFPCVAVDMTTVGRLPGEETNSEVLVDALPWFFLGAPIGIGLWGFYRLVRFAIKG